VSRHFALKSRIGIGIHLPYDFRLSGGVGIISHREWQFLDNPKDKREIGRFELPDQRFFSLSLRLVM